MDETELVRRFLEEQRKKEERLSQTAEELMLEDLYECIDFEAVTICHPKTMQNLMAEISEDPHGLEYYHLAVYAISLYKVVCEVGIKTPCKTIQELSGQHLSKVAMKAGLTWRQVESLLVG